MINQNEKQYKQYKHNNAIYTQLDKVFASSSKQTLAENKKIFLEMLPKRQDRKTTLFSTLFNDLSTFPVYQRITKLNPKMKLPSDKPLGFFDTLMTQHSRLSQGTIIAIRELITSQQTMYAKTHIQPEESHTRPLDSNTATLDSHTETQNNSIDENIQRFAQTAPKTRFQTYAPYIKPSLMMVAGSGLALFGGMLQFNPQFALWVGLQLHPVMLAALVIGGMMIAGTGIYNAIGKYQAHSNPIAEGSPVESTQVSRGIYVSLLQRFGSFGLTPEQPTASLTNQEQMLTSTTSEPMSR